ncbi:GNAT family N-acetyltransferase [Solihabitans fulvus]|uniref:GNAT family N-acetyltransferase n=1 Tax=Solihabitans fulvus TaxID=1892852 RepID=A0A5B2WSR4_9PSEU|nr:GNAT family N-acetyltransferase [Solihabitans fulvus]KAA2253870.1 GNAT family N-acetyltransferase [Solihabitans fulvus]
MRRADLADLDAVVALHLAETRYAEQVSGTAERANTEALFREVCAAALAVDRPWVWVAEHDGEVIGVTRMEPPSESSWFAPLVAAAPAAYLSCQSVAERHRGGGVGAALIRRAHAAADRAGAAAILLHHAALNPLSAPFWNRCGYRPLWTNWELSPAR